MSNVLVHDGSLLKPKSDVNINQPALERMARRFIKYVVEGYLDKMGVGPIMRFDPNTDGTITCSVSGKDSSCLESCWNELIVRKACDLANEAGITTKLVHDGGSDGSAKVFYEFWLTEK